MKSLLINNNFDVKSTDSSLQKDVPQDHSCNNCQMLSLSKLCLNSVDSLKLLNENKKTILLDSNQELKISGDYSRSLFLLKKGVVKLFSSNEHFSDLEIFYEGSFLGGHSFVGAEDLNVVAKACQAVELCEINEETLKILILVNPSFYKRYFILLAAYISGLKQNKYESKSLPLTSIIAKSLQKDFKARGYLYNGTLRVTKIMNQTEWGLFLGVRRESVSRAFQELEKANAIKTDSGTIQLVSETNLIKFLVVS